MICITNDPLDPDSITARVRSVHNGAIVTFLGTIREDAGDRKVLYLEYEAYRPMADNKLRDVVKELQSRWNVQQVAIYHRIGKVMVGDVSLVVSVGTPHRPEAFDAIQHSVNLIKNQVPIWKKEVFEDGEVWVEGINNFK